MMSFWVVPLSCRAVDPVLLGDGDVEAEQPGGGRVDRHRGVHLVERDAVEAAGACRPCGRSRRRPCRPRRGRGRGRGHSRSGSAGRRRPRGRSGPWPGCRGRARWSAGRRSGRRRCASPRGGRAREVGGRSSSSMIFARGGKTAVHRLTARIFRPGLCLGWRSMKTRDSQPSSWPRSPPACSPAPSPARRWSASTATDGDHAQRGQLVKLSGEQLRPRRLRTTPCGSSLGKQTERMLLPHAGARPRPRDRRDRAPAQRHPEGAAAQGLPRRSTCAPGAAPSYQLAVFPLQRKAQLRKVTADGTSSTCEIAKNVQSGRRASTKPTSCGCAPSTSPAAPNKGQCQILAYVGGKLVADVTDDGAGELRAAPPASRSARSRTPRASSPASTTSSSAFPARSEPARRR